MSGSNGPVRYPVRPPHPHHGDYRHDQANAVDPHAAEAGSDYGAGTGSAGFQGYVDDATQPATQIPNQSYADYANRPPRQLNPQPAPQRQQPAVDQGYYPQSNGGFTRPASQFTQAEPTLSGQSYSESGYQHRPASGIEPQWSPGDAHQARDPFAGGTGPSFGHPQDQHYTSAGRQQPASHSFGSQGYEALQQHAPALQPTHGYPAPEESFQQAAPHAPPSGYDFGAHHASATGFSTSEPVRAPIASTRIDWGNSAGQGAVDPAFHGQDFHFAAHDPSLDPAKQSVAVEHGFEGEADEFEDEHEDEEEGWSRGSKVIVIAALAGAIVVGGGVAYGYQALFAPMPSNAPPVVRSAEGPSKVKPSDPGGRKFAHTDSKIMGRLGGSEVATTDPSSGARKVSTLKIGPDGSIIPPSVPTAGGPRMVSGMTLGDSVAVSGSGPTPINAPKSAEPPVEIAKVAPVTRTAPTSPQPAPVKAAAPPPKPAPKVISKPKPTETAALPPATKPAPASTGPKPTGAGYVAVLASVPASNSSRLDALKQFADMQQKYGSVLSNRTPDVQEANLGAKGTYHRLIAGPPGSADSARAVCNDLKAAGYSSCWVLAF